jgi:hypothetical protein
MSTKERTDMSTKERGELFEWIRINDSAVPFDTDLLVAVNSFGYEFQSLAEAHAALCHG